MKRYATTGPGLFDSLPFGDTIAPRAPVSLAGSLRNDGGYAAPPPKRIPKNAGGLAVRAADMILAGRGLGSRAFDSLFEQGNGANVALALKARVGADVELARAVLRHRHYMGPDLIALAEARIADPAAEVADWDETEDLDRATTVEQKGPNQ